jgi:hypothetical protein
VRRPVGRGTEGYRRLEQIGALHGSLSRLPTLRAMDRKVPETYHEWQNEKMAGSTTAFWVLPRQWETEHSPQPVDSNRGGFPSAWSRSGALEKPVSNNLKPTTMSSTYQTSDSAVLPLPFIHIPTPLFLTHPLHVRYPWFLPRLHGNSFKRRTLRWAICGSLRGGQEDRWWVAMRENRHESAQS